MADVIFFHDIDINAALNLKDYYKKIKTKVGIARSKCGPCFSG
ncbi:hypothetical protein HNP68_001043 [Borrelia yangtzensis]|uniref:Uncharacterized protein n=1 Tax=Borreliella yangtzensis TaxID=683292 RepID=A0ABR6PFC0_9SPIR|nr:hypothetical protein [Borreliella yangtzensis]